MGCLVFTCWVFLGSACTCASCCTIILSPSGDSARRRSCGSGITPMSGSWKAVNAAASCGWSSMGWWGVFAEEVVSMVWYTVSNLVPIKRTYFPMYFLTEILLCIRIVMQSCSRRLSGVVNVSTFCPVRIVRNWSMFPPPCIHLARSPRSLNLSVLTPLSVMCVSLRMVVNPDWSSSDAYWMFASCGVSVGSGIVRVRHSQASVSSQFVLSSSLSMGVSCCMIFLLDFGWAGSGGGVLDVLVSVWFSGGAVDMTSVLCRFLGVCPSALNLLGFLWLPCVTCAQLAWPGLSSGVSFIVVWLGCLCLVGVFCPLDVT